MVFLHQQYGGGPELSRSTLDVYAPSCTDISAQEPLLARSMDDMFEFPVAECEDCSSPRGLTCGPSLKILRRGWLHSRSRSTSRDRRSPESTDGQTKFGAASGRTTNKISKSDSTTDRSGMVFFVKEEDARVTPQPPDGSCLFHSMNAGLGDGCSPSLLRLEISKYILDHPDMLVAGTPLDNWVKHDSGEGTSAYATRMANGLWGGGIEMEVLTRLKDVNVHVFEKCKGGFQRISCFDAPGAAEKHTVNVLYQGRNHYDSLTLIGTAGDWISRRPTESQL